MRRDSHRASAGLLRSLAVAALASLAVSRPCSAQEPPHACRTDSTTRVESRLAYLKDLVASSDTERAQMRRTLGIGTAPASRVGLVHDEARCARAVAALNRHRKELHRQRRVWLYDIGSGYALDDPSLDVLGSDQALHFLDRHFGYRSGVVGF